MRAITTIGLVLTVLAVFTAATGARGSHGAGHGLHAHGMHGGSAGGFASDKRHGDDAYTKAASDEEDRLLDSKLKSICRGC